MLTEPDDELTQVIAMLQDDCVAKLPAAIAEIGDFWLCLIAGEAPLTDLPNMVAKAHGLAGAGAMFGLPALKMAARDLEQHLEAIRVASRRPNSVERERFTVLMTALQRAA